jgi:DNA-binding transcriptional MerR regulator
MDKSPDAFRTISEVADHLDTPAHVLRFWESRFPQIRPVKRAGGRRYYRPSDVALLAGIKRLLHDEGLTIRGVQRILKDQGVRSVAGMTVDLDEAAVAPGPAPRPAPSPAPAPVPAAPGAASPPPAAPAQPGLPLFDAVAPKAARLAEDRTPAGVLRALPPGALRLPGPELAALAARLRSLRDRMADRADGGS